MFGIGGTELLLLLLIALLVFGPENLPELARKLARIIGEVRKASDEVRMHIDPDGELYRATRFPPVQPYTERDKDGIFSDDDDDEDETAALEDTDTGKED